jgi:hypothetical protein
LRLFGYTDVMSKETDDKPKVDMPDSSEVQDPQDPKPRKPIPLISVPNDRDMIAEEMAELFEEDEVTHQHGSSEPEAD